MLDEERRLFYVAITRAMQTLTLSHCVTRKKYGGMTRCHPSPFLRESRRNFSNRPTKRQNSRCRSKQARTFSRPCAWPREIKKRSRTAMPFPDLFCS